MINTYIRIIPEYVILFFFFLLIGTGCWKGTQEMSNYASILYVSDSALKEHVKFIATSSLIENDTVFILDANLPPLVFENISRYNKALFVRKGQSVVHVNANLSIVDTFYALNNEKFLLYSYYSKYFNDSIFHLKTIMKEAHQEIYSVFVYSQKFGLLGLYRLDQTPYIMSEYGKPLFVYFIGNEIIFNDIDTAKYRYVVIDPNVQINRL